MRVESAKTSILKCHAPRRSNMAQELDHYCPECDTERTFYRTASTNLHLGLKTKWGCPECDFRFVQIDGDIDSAAEA